MQSQLKELPEKVTPISEPQERDLAEKANIVVKELPSIVQIAYSKHGFTGLKGRISLAYTDGFRATAKFGVTIAPQTTLREYLKNVAPLLRIASGPFAELTTLTEIALYSNHELDENMASQVERLAATIKQS